MTDEEFATYSLKYKKRFRKKIEKKPQPVKILMNRTINSGLMIVKDIQGIPFERLSFSLYFFCQDLAMKEFTRSYEAQLELAAIDAEKFLNQLHNFYTKISLRIVKEGLYREFFEFVFHCCRLRMEGVMDSGEVYNGPQKSDHCRRKEREHGRIGPTIERKRYHGTQTVQPTV